jgi:hypothetical protein
MSDKPEIPYTLPPNTKLRSDTDKMTVIPHVSPDAGWPVLRDFLNRTTSRLTVGMYAFTSAHVLDALEAALKPGGRTLELVLDHPPQSERQPERRRDKAGSGEDAEHACQDRLGADAQRSAGEVLDLSDCLSH